MLDRVVGKIPGTERRTMFGYAAIFAGNKLSVGLFGDGVCMKLSPKDRAAALKLPGVTEFVPMANRVMREYVFFTKRALEDEERLETWARKSVEYTLTHPEKKEPEPEAGSQRALKKVAKAGAKKPARRPKKRSA